MEYEISGDILQVVSMQLKQGEKVYCESGALAWMTDNVKMETKAKGGLGKSIGRMFSGESFFLVDYFVESGTGVVTFAAEYPGKTIPFDLDSGASVICQKDSFLVAEESVDMKVHFIML